MGGNAYASQEAGVEPMCELANPVRMVRQLFQRRSLVKRLVVRQVMARYKGSYFGIIWSLVTPLMMLGVYVFVFGVVFQGRWGRPEETELDYGLAIFAGLIVYGVFRDCVAAAPQLILSNSGYVKKVVFPLEILPVIALGGALVNACLSLSVLIPLTLAFGSTIPVTIWLFPGALIPLCALTLGLTYFLSSIGVFVRDISYPVGVAVMILLFLSGVFFPVSSVPSGYQMLLTLNPLYYILEASRQTLLWGQIPDLQTWLLNTAATLTLMQAGYAWFMKTRGAFADVI